MSKFKTEKPIARLNILISDELRRQYKIHCLKKEVILSNRIRQLIEMDINGEIKDK